MILRGSMRKSFQAKALLLASLLAAGCLQPTEKTDRAGAGGTSLQNLSQKISTASVDEELKAELGALVARLESNPNYQITPDDIDLLKEAGLLEDGDLEALGT